MFLADEENHHERLFRIGEVARVRRELESRLQRPANIQLVLDKPLWINKGELAVEREVCQLVDVALYFTAKAVESKVWNNEWIKRLSPYFARHWISGQVWDGGITIYPRPRYPRFPF